jgi:hypothetical protein
MLPVGADIAAELSRVCPTPTSSDRLDRIAAELAKALRDGAALNTLATEWERLDEAARACRRDGGGQ